VTTAVVPKIESRSETDQESWVVVVWDDPVNLIVYVIYVLRTHFRYSREKATELTMQVHNHGKAVVFTGGKQECLSHVKALHSYGLWATAALA
jgi:ATP-dependent Clp protease adaptor protein ClpS